MEYPEFSSGGWSLSAFCAHSRGQSELMKKLQENVVWSLDRSGIRSKCNVPSGNLLQFASENCPFIVDLPIKNCDF